MAYAINRILASYWSLHGWYTASCRTQHYSYSLGYNNVTLLLNGLLMPLSASLSYSKAFVPQSPWYVLIMRRTWASMLEYLYITTTLLHLICWQMKDKCYSFCCNEKFQHATLVSFWLFRSLNGANVLLRECQIVSLNNLGFPDRWNISPCRFINQ